MEQNLDERKLDIIKFQILDMETENTVKKESNPAMVEKIKKMIIRERRFCSCSISLEFIIPEI